MKKARTARPTTIVCVTRERAHDLGCELGKRGVAWRRKGRVLRVRASVRQILAASKRTRAHCKLTHGRSR